VERDQCGVGMAASLFSASAGELLSLETLKIVLTIWRLEENHSLEQVVSEIILRERRQSHEQA
jgi:hypothetical protein